MAITIIKISPGRKRKFLPARQRLPSFEEGLPSGQAQRDPLGVKRHK